MENNLSNYDEVTLILLGKTGHGKSTLCNLLGDTSDFLVSDSIQSCTKTINQKEYINNENKVKISIIDTPGFSDSDGDDPKIIEDMKNHLTNTNLPRINTILIVISIQEPRIDKSITNFLEIICCIFPLKDFWNHVIVVWTHYSGSESKKKRDKEKAQKFEKEFIELTKSINEKFHISINTINELKMIFNEYDVEETDKSIININEIESKKNINKIISFMKDMKPIYAKILEPRIEIEQISEKKEGKFIIFENQKVRIREYIDFDEKKIQCKDILLKYKIKREDSETDFLPFESQNPNIKKFNKYKKYIFYDSDEKIIKQEKTEEITDWKTIEEKKETEINQINENRRTIHKIKYILECTKNNPNGIKRNQETYEDYIEEWREEEIKEEQFDNNHCGYINHKYYKYLYLIKKESETKQENTKIEIPEKEYKEIYEKDNDLKTKIIEEDGTQYKITYYNIIKIDSRDPTNKHGTQYTIQKDKIRSSLERFEKREVKIINNKIYNQNYKIYYILNEEGKEKILKEEPNGPEEIIDLETIEKYEIEGLTNNQIEEKRRNKDYPIIYKRNYYKQELNTKAKNKININKVENVIINLEHFSDKINRNEINYLIEYDKEIFDINGEKTIQEQKLNIKEYILREKDEKREMKIENDTIYYQNYKIYYVLENNEIEKILKEEPIGEEEPIPLEAIEKYEIEGLTNSQIEEKRRNKNYPIIYKRNYYKQELNTKAKKRINLNKVENVVINLEHYSEKIKRNEINYFIYYDKEIFDINGQPKIQEQKLNIKEYILKEKDEEREMKIENDTIYYQNYKIYYNENENIRIEEPIGGEKPIPLEVIEKYEIEGLTNSQIEEKRRNKDYPIIYKRNYYKQELNTKAKKRINLNKVENVVINLEHYSEKINRNGIYYFVYYDKEIFDINGQPKIQEQKRNIKEYILKEKDEEREIKIENDTIYYQNYKIYYNENENIRIEEPIGGEKPIPLEVIEKYEIEGLTNSQIEEKRRNKDYPIKYKRNYYKQELNTKAKKRININKVENVIINLEHFSEKINRNEINYLIEYDKEIFDINGQPKIQEQKLNIKEYILREKDEKREMKIENDTIYYDIYKIYYIINSFGNENIIKEEKYDEKTDEIMYKTYEKYEGMTEEEIKDKRDKKIYPIIYKKIYYKEELNTERKYTKIDKIEDVIINIQHFSHIITLDDKEFLEDYDQEIYSINGEVNQNYEDTIKFNYSLTHQKKIKYKFEEIEKRKVSYKYHFFTDSEHKFDIYKRYRIIYDNDKTEYTPWSYDRTQTLYYD